MGRSSAAAVLVLVAVALAFIAGIAGLGDVTRKDTSVVEAKHYRIRLKTKSSIMVYVNGELAVNGTEDPPTRNFWQYFQIMVGGCTSAPIYDVSGATASPAWCSSWTVYLMSGYAADPWTAFTPVGSYVTVQPTIYYYDDGTYYGLQVGIHYEATQTTTVSSLGLAYGNIMMFVYNLPYNITLNPGDNLTVVWQILIQYKYGSITLTAVKTLFDILKCGVVRGYVLSSSSLCIDTCNKPKVTSYGPPYVGFTAGYNTFSYPRVYASGKSTCDENRVLMYGFVIPNQAYESAFTATNLRLYCYSASYCGGGGCYGGCTLSLQFITSLMPYHIDARSTPVLVFLEVTR